MGRPSRKMPAPRGRQNPAPCIPPRLFLRPVRDVCGGRAHDARKESASRGLQQSQRVHPQDVPCHKGEQRGASPRLRNQSPSRRWSPARCPKPAARRTLFRNRSAISHERETRVSKMSADQRLGCCPGSLVRNTRWSRTPDTGRAAPAVRRQNFATNRPTPALCPFNRTMFRGGSPHCRLQGRNNGRPSARNPRRSPRCTRTLGGHHSFHDGDAWKTDPDSRDGSVEWPNPRALSPTVPHPRRPPERRKIHGGPHCRVRHKHCAPRLAAWSETGVSPKPRPELQFIQFPATPRGPAVQGPASPAAHAKGALTGKPVPGASGPGNRRIKTRLPTNGRNSSGIDPLSSMVR